MKKIIISISVLSIILITNYIYNNNYSSKNVIVNGFTSHSTTNSSAISMMLETDYNSGMYEVSTSTSWPGTGYTFNETLSKCSNGGTISYDKDTNTVYFNGISKDYCYVYFDLIYTIDDVCDSGGNLSLCIQELYNETGEGTVNIYYHDGTGDYTNAELEAGDYSYRYSGGGNEVLNFVCFGSDDCTDTDNLYRIIGIFQNDSGDYEVKLIKYDYCTSDMCGEDGDYYGNGSTNETYKGNLDEISFYFWNSINFDTAYSATGLPNSWYFSQLNTVNLNTNYYNSLDSTWQDMITTHTWIVGGNTTENIRSSNALTAYQTELISYDKNQMTTEFQTYTDEVGLIYVSDYYYSVEHTYWNYSGYDEELNDYRKFIDYNWLYNGQDEWTITRSSTVPNNTFSIFFYGYIFSGYILGGRAIRPTFYLTSSVEYSSGSGTLDDPIILVTE